MDLETLTADLATFPLFSDLDDAERREIARALEPFALEAGRAVFSSGAMADRVFLISEGRIEIDGRGSDEKAARVATAGPGDTVGEIALIDRTERATTACVSAATRGHVLTTARFDELRSAHRPAAYKVLLRLCVALSERMRDVTSTLVGSPSSARGPKGVAGFESSSPPRPETRARLPVLPLFERFTDVELDELVAQTREVAVPRGRVLFEEGSDGRSCYLAVRGAIEVFVQRGQRRRRLAILGPGRLFGELSLLDAKPRSATCRAREDATLLELSAEAFARMFAAGSPAAFKLLDEIARGLAGTIGRAGADLVSGPAAARVAAPPAPGRRRAAYDRDALLLKIRESIIGDDVVLEGPFGPRRMVYADYTASGRSLAFIEDFVRHEIMPFYGNTHTESSGTGLYTTRLREDARKIIHRAVNGGDDDVVIFCGSGATGAIDKLIRALNLSLPADLDARYGLRAHVPPAERPVVFVGPYEHHSNDLPWRMSIAEVVTIDEDDDGRINLADLERRLVQYRDRPLKIGSFSAASNVTGIISDDIRIATLLHEHGALSFWDFAAAGPYLRVDMNPTPVRATGGSAHKDAVFISPHKFVGGPGTPGVLVAKRGLFKNTVPTVPGGGTVAFVSPDDQRFLADIVHREEGGTPAIIESIRAGLVFQLKEAIGTDTIHRLEESFIRRAIESWSRNPNIWILGNPKLERLSIVSLVIRHQERFLHWNFVVALLNDLFGIQARGGCSCAGPYGHRLFRIDDRKSREYQKVILEGGEGIKPGWFRVNFNYFISETAFDYIVRAVHLVADHGWKLLPDYRFDPATALWRHRKRPPLDPPSLDAVTYVAGAVEFDSARTHEPESALAGYLEAATEILTGAGTDSDSETAADEPMSDGFEKLRWFPLPAEIRAALRSARSK